MVDDQKAYFLEKITDTPRSRYNFLSDLCQITHRMLLFSDSEQVFPSLWLVMCIGEHQMQLDILNWFATIAADEFLFDSKKLEEEMKAEKEKGEKVMEVKKSQEMETSIGNDKSVNHVERHMLWEAFLWLGVHLLNTENLKLEQMTSQKRDFIETNFGDLRDQVCDVLTMLWDKLDDQKLLVAEPLIMPLLRLTDSGHARSREFGSNLYFDILRTEYQKTQALHGVENYTIDAVTSIVAERNRENRAQSGGGGGDGGGSGSIDSSSVGGAAATTSREGGSLNVGGYMTEQQKGEKVRSPGEGFLELFTSQLENKFRDDDVLRSKLAVRFLEGIKELFVLLSNLSKYESAADSSVFEDERCASMLVLMKYLKETGREDMRIKYVKKLTQLHKSLGSHVEAGHVILLTMDTDTKVGEGEESIEKKVSEDELHLRSNNSSSSSSSSSSSDSSSDSPLAMSQREIQLTELAIESFKHGDDWRSALTLLDRLKKYYESVSYQFDRLASVLDEQASLYRKVHTSESYYCSFFRVSFMGKQWDEQNQNQIFIYRGGPLESIMAFVARIKRKDPSVIIVSPGKETKEMEEEDKCYLQISSVKPAYNCVWTEGKETEWSSNIPKRVVEYDLNYNVNTFTFSRPFRKAAIKSKNEFMDLWTKTFVLRTKDTLPGTTRRTCVMEVREIFLNPLEVAVNTVRDKNADLMIRIDRANLLKERNVPQSYTMAINGTVDGEFVLLLLLLLLLLLYVLCFVLFCLLLILVIPSFLLCFFFQHSCGEWWHCKFCSFFERYV